MYNNAVVRSSAPPSFIRGRSLQHVINTIGQVRGDVGCIDDVDRGPGFRLRFLCTCTLIDPAMHDVLYVAWGPLDRCSSRIEDVRMEHAGMHA